MRTRRGVAFRATLARFTAPRGLRETCVVMRNVFDRSESERSGPKEDGLFISPLNISHMARKQYVSGRNGKHVFCFARHRFFLLFFDNCLFSSTYIHVLAMVLLDNGLMC